ncbi:UDP-N-acetylmuramoyl-L-alanine--D-glutamate ligase, partial [Francisella tularensis subsp. holarctica]|nr:UDP-N-acetylmuramoyl-L-alanine--D-glutamate ligase [Francisella tularensis subsp. holarctica]
MVGYGSTGKSVCDFLANCIYITFDISQNDDEFVNYYLNSYDLITVSPGIPLNKSPYRSLTKFKDKIVSDIDIFYKYIKDTKAKTI